MRRLLLWMASNERLRRELPRLGFVRRAVSRFMPGEDAESALLAAESFRADQLGAVFTYLGENVTSLEEVDAVAVEYERLISAIHNRRIDGEISVKLTQLGLDLDAEQCLRQVGRLAECAAAVSQTIWIDMESSQYTEVTLSGYEQLKTRYTNVGICLQAYLHRTAADLQRLVALNPAVRLVKGAYAEAANVAYSSSRDINANFLALAVELFHAQLRGRLVRIGLGTHDTDLIMQVGIHAKALGLPKTCFEVQMLYGIRPEEQKRLARNGYVVRDLVAYGNAWYPWYLRRLAERPANVLFALRQLFP